MNILTKIKLIKKLSLLSLLTMLSCVLFAQVQHNDLIYYKNKYPEKSYIKIKDITEMLIDFGDNDTLKVETTFFEENIYLDKYSGKSSEHSVSSSYFREISDIEAMSYIPVNAKKYKKHKVTEFEEKSIISSSVFFDDTKDIMFTYPHLKEGAKTTLKYTSRLKLPQLISSCYFASYTATEYQEYKVTHHKDINIDFKMFNGIDTLVTYNKTSKGDYVIHSWISKNMKPLEYESSAQSYVFVAPHIYPLITTYKKDGKEIPLLRNTEDLHKWYTELLGMSKIEESPELNSLVDSLISDKEKELEKVEVIFDYVQKNIKYVAYENGLGGFVPRPPQKVFQRKFGDCKDMSFLLVKMYDIANINAYPTWVGTRDKPYTYAEMPTPACDNHMIASYKTQNGNWMFLDATGTYTPFGYPSSFIQTKEVMIHIDENNYEIINVGEVDYKKNEFTDIVELRIEDGKSIKGEGKAYITGYRLENLKYKVLDTDSIGRTKTLKNKLEKGSNKFFFTLNDYDFSKSDSGVVNYSFLIKDYLKINGDEIYLNLNLDKIFANNRIDKLRKTAIKKDFKFNMKCKFIFDLEDKYVVEYLPKNKSYDNEEYGFNITYNIENGKIIYNLEIISNKLLVKPDEFEYWNDMVKQLNRKYKEVIVLKSKK